MTLIRIIPIGLAIISQFSFATCFKAEPSITSELQTRSETQIRALVSQQKKRVDSTPALTRNLAILFVNQAGSGALDAKTVEFLDGFINSHPEDLFAKMYTGYAWLFSADKAAYEKNYLNAAEYLKKGFFLTDEAVDLDPENWRLRYLRMRMDAFIPKEYGRYVVAFSDADKLQQIENQLPEALLPYVVAFKVNALNISGESEEADFEINRAKSIYTRSEITKLMGSCELATFLTPKEVTLLLQYAMKNTR